MASDVMHRKKLDRSHLSDSNFRESEDLNGLNVNMDFLSKFPKILVDERIHLFWIFCNYYYILKEWKWICKFLIENEGEIRIRFIYYDNNI